MTRQVESSVGGVSPRAVVEQELPAVLPLEIALYQQPKQRTIQGALEAPVSGHVAGTTTRSPSYRRGRSDRNRCHARLLSVASSHHLGKPHPGARGCRGLLRPERRSTARTHTPQPPIAKDGHRVSERYLGRFERPSQVGADDSRQAVFCSPASNRGRLFAPNWGQPAGQPARSPPGLFVLGCRMRLEDDLDRHATTFTCPEDRLRGRWPRLEALAPAELSVRPGSRKGHLCGTCALRASRCPGATPRPRCPGAGFTTPSHPLKLLLTERTRE